MDVISIHLLSSWSGCSGNLEDVGFTCDPAAGVNTVVKVGAARVVRPVSDLTHLL
jgi:hypothetical protein